MMSVDAERPRITLGLSLDPRSHSYSSPTPPTLSVTAALHASSPITVLIWHSALHPHLALRQGAFQITDLSTATVVKQLSIMLSRAPIQRKLGGPDDAHFVTIYPETPVTVSTLFGNPSGVAGKPLPEGHEGRLRQAAGGMAVARSVCGVDGLRLGTRYRLEIVDGVHRSLTVDWWKWGTRDEVLAKECEPADLGEGDGSLVMEAEDGSKVEFETTE
ncbi:hypothetical protein F5B20DRAFT_522352 [Whalleya microplaca]|nr:hypothetical protein F5B20DRAFT_522352 [Whalleya microplaca]